MSAYNMPKSEKANGMHALLRRLSLQCALRCLVAAYFHNGDDVPSVQSALPVTQRPGENGQLGICIAPLANAHGAFGLHRVSGIEI